MAYTTQISLIANTGIQFYASKVNLGGAEQDDDENPMLNVRCVFYEDRTNLPEIQFDYAYKHKKSGMFVKYDTLRKSAAYDEDNDKVLEHKIQPEDLEAIRDDWKIKTDVASSLEIFENKWLPIPYFKLEMFDAGRVSPFSIGPESWVRMYLNRIPESERQGDYTHEVILAFDTQIHDAKAFPIDEGTKKPIHVALTKQDYEHTFKCPSERFMLDYCGREWVQKWIEVEHNERAKELGQVNKQNREFLHVARYLTLLTALKNASVVGSGVEKYASRAVFPDVVLHRQGDVQNPVNPIEVDLILDVGNARTYGLVVETIAGKQPIDFSNVKPLPIRDLSFPNKLYSNPFGMQVTFAKHEFGRDEQYFRQYHKETGSLEMFKWGSLVRVGPEANRLAILNTDKAIYSSLSSPKRYLWDTEKREDKWTYIKKDAKEVAPTHYQGALYGMANLFAENGGLVEEELKKEAKLAQNENRKPALIAPAFGPNFSRGSVMTFALTEILMHAFAFINSADFRQSMGNAHRPRKLKRIVLTCPTAMIPEEQRRLREHARTAVRALQQFYGETHSFVTQDLEVIPNPEHLVIQENDGTTTVKDWSFDEATCNQLLFIYGEIATHFQNNPKLFFKSKGKVRDDASFSGTRNLANEKERIEREFANDYEGLEKALKDLEEKRKTQDSNPAVTIASLDIGGGTTDLMICTYQNDPKAIYTSVQPKPEFWEGFQVAGDDILKMLIERIVLPTIREEAHLRGCEGKNLDDAMRICFGSNWTGTEAIAEAKHYRKQFAVQIGVPIALGCLDFVRNLPATATDITQKKFTQFFGNYPRPNTPHNHLRAHINKVFTERGAQGFSIDTVIFTLDAKRINQVVADVVEEILGDLCQVVSQFKCDYLLLCGKPGGLPIVREIALRYMPVIPERIIALEGYRTGSWCPFGTSNGVIEDGKTCVAVGAMVALLGGKLNLLENFKLDTSLLAKNVKSTADFIGVFDKNTRRLRHDNNDKVLFNIRKNGKTENTVIFHTPILLGLRQMNDALWHASPIYRLGWKNPDSGKKLNHVLPLQVTLEIETEQVEKGLNYFMRFNKIVEATPLDEKHEEAGNSFDGELEIVLQTLADEHGYWLDTGVFDYNVYASQSQQ